MACLADVFTEEEKINWLKAWLAIDISKSGLEQFVENEAKTLHANIYNNVWSSTTSPAVCIGCHTANLLKCPTPGICNRHGRNNTCTSMHDTASKQPRPCHVNLCNKVFDEISKNHKYRSPSWKNTTAKNWASNAWQIAKAYLPPDGYAEKNSIQETDFNGVVSFMINCKQFDSKFSFAISPGKPNPPCLLTKARDIGRKVRHSSQCKVTDADLQDIFTTLTSLLTDPTCLAQDVAAQEAVKKLAELLNDVLKITTAEMIHLLEAAQDTLNNVENVAAKTLNKIRVYIEHYKELTDKCKQELNEHTAKCKDALNEHGQRTAESKYEQACEEMTRCMVKLYTRTLSHVTTSPLNECVQVRLGQIFMPPNIQLMKENKGFFKKTGEQITRYKDVFIKDGQLNRRIFIQGEAGTGKSTFLAKLVLDWCRTTTVEQFPNNECTISGSSTFFADLNILKDYTFVFRVTLRDSVIKFDIYTMIKEQIVDSLYSSEEDREKAYTSLNEIMKRELCLILLDGLDEWTGLGDKHNLPTLVENHSHCVLLITTRPWKLVEERIKHSEMDILLQLEGIHDPLKMSRMFLSCLVNREELNKKHSAFLRYIREQKLDELLSSPMMLSVIVCFYAEGTELKGSLCEIYSLLLDSLLKKASSQKKYFQQPPFTCLKETQYIKPNIDNVNQIAKVAFCLLFSETKENSIVFGVKELEALVEDGHRKFALKAGILTETKTLCVVRSTSTFSFIHKSVQEFLAAYHIACNEHVINDVISGYRKRLDKSTSDISHVYIFLCGLSIPAANALSSLINDIHAAQNITLAGYTEAVSNMQTDIYLKLCHFNVNALNMNIALQKLWENNASNVVSLAVDMDEGLGLHPSKGSASRIVFDLSSCNKLQSLTLCGDHTWITDSSSLVTSEFPIRIQLNRAYREKCAEALPLLPSIKNIKLKGIICSSEWLRCLFRMLLTVNHQVKSELDCHITSREEFRAIRSSTTYTYATITTDLKYTFNMSGLVHNGSGLWEALVGLKIKSLSLSAGWQDLNMRNLPVFSQSLLSLKQLETLIIERVGPDVLKAIGGLHIKSLKIIFEHTSLISQSLSSLIQLETLTMYMRSYIGLQLPKSLKILHFYCEALSPSELRALLNTLSSCTGTVACNIEFGCAQWISSYSAEGQIEQNTENKYRSTISYDHVKGINKIQLEEYNPIRQELNELENVAVKRFQILEPGDESVYGEYDEAYNKFVLHINIYTINRISMRLQIRPLHPSTLSPSTSKKCVVQ